MSENNKKKPQNIGTRIQKNILSGLKTIWDAIKYIFFGIVSIIGYALANGIDIFSGFLGSGGTPRYLKIKLRNLTKDEYTELMDLHEKYVIKGTEVDENLEEEKKMGTEEKEMGTEEKEMGTEEKEMGTERFKELKVKADNISNEDITHFRKYYDNNDFINTLKDVEPEVKPVELLSTVVEDVRL